MSAPGRTDGPVRRDGLRERVLGGRDRLGWWLLPLFIMVGLGGAVLAGALAVVYYAQQVSQLEAETREAREEVVGAADEVREAADDALTAIDEEVAAVREELARGLPLEDALDVGVVRLEVTTRLPDTRQRPAAAGDVEPASLRAPRAAPADDGDDGDEGDDGEGGSPDEPPEDGDGDGSGADDGEDGSTDDDASPDGGQDPSPPPSRTVPLRRSATGFVVVVDGETAFVATSLGFLDDPRTDDRVPADVEVTVRLNAGTTTATVHSWDESHDLLLLRARIGNVEPLPWREQGSPLTPGDRVIGIGSTPDLTAVRLGSEVAAVSSRALITSLPPLQQLDGGPVVDVEGNVVGVAVSSHARLGGDPAVVPVRRLCNELLSTCPD